MSHIQYQPLAPSHFADVIRLGNQVHGDNYLDDNSIRTIYQNSFSHNINASWVAFDNNDLIGFRLTLAASHWSIDQWCTPQEWNTETEMVCYFKCNTVDANYRGHGVGSAMLLHSISSAKQQGAKAGLAHIWLASPGNSAYRYFVKNGGELIKKHPDKWLASSTEEGYICPLCGDQCHCVAAEMLLPFS